MKMMKIVQLVMQTSGGITDYERLVFIIGGIMVVLLLLAIMRMT